MNKHFLTISLAWVSLVPFVSAQTREPEILITAKVFECTEETAEKLGLKAGKDELSPRIRGMLPPATFEDLIKRLNKEKGVDLLSAPSVTTKSGLRALVEVTREFRYPKEFGGTDAAPDGLGILVPEEFTTKNVGVSLDVEPVAGPDSIIDLTCVPTITEFEGFINFADGKTAALGTENAIPPHGFQQPVFSTKTSPFGISVRSGYTVLLGGFNHEQRQVIEDKVPLAGQPWGLNRILGKQETATVRTVEFKKMLLFITVTPSLVTREVLPALLADSPVRLDMEYYSVSLDKLPGDISKLILEGRQTLSQAQIQQVAGAIQTVPEVSPLKILPQVVASGGQFALTPHKPFDNTRFQVSPRLEPDGKVDLKVAASNGQIMDEDLAMTEVTVAAGQTVLVASQGKGAADPVGLLFVTGTGRPADAKLGPELPVSTPAPPEGLLVALPVPGKPGFVRSPYAPDKGFVDVRGFPSGTEVKCPYTGKTFRIP